MGSAGPGVLGSMLFLMLGLQPLPLSRGRSLHHPPNSRSFHPGSRHHGSTWEKLKSCEGAFDLYFIVDASQKAKDIWEDICQLVDEITTKYTNPDLRMSFITYSTQGRIVMKLTSDRQINRFNKLPQEAQQARDMGAKVYCVGVKDYERDQLNDIVERKDQMYGTEEFNSAETFVTSLVKNSCMEAMAGDTHFVCLGGWDCGNLSGLQLGKKKQKMQAHPGKKRAYNCPNNYHNNHKAYHCHNEHDDHNYNAYHSHDNNTDNHHNTYHSQDNNNREDHNTYHSPDNNNNNNTEDHNAYHSQDNNNNNNTEDHNAYHNHNAYHSQDNNNNNNTEDHNAHHSQDNNNNNTEDHNAYHSQNNNNNNTEDHNTYHSQDNNNNNTEDHNTYHSQNNN
ncbi:TPA: anthrax toxin receptor 1-like, partial [Bos taurus]